MILNSIDGASSKRCERFDRTQGGFSAGTATKARGHDRRRSNESRGIDHRASLSIYLRERPVCTRARAHESLENRIHNVEKQRRSRPVQPSAKHLNLPALMPTVYASVAQRREPQIYRSHDKSFRLGISLSRGYTYIHTYILERD